MSLSDRIIVMNKGKIVQIGSPHQVYRDPASAFVAGFIGKVAFLPAEVAGVDAVCTVKVRGRTFTLPRFSPDLRAGDSALVMCRPESLTLLPPGEGILDGRVTTNVYLGHSIESFVSTEMGEILVQVDNPDARQIFSEGEAVSVSFIPELTKALPAGEE